MTKFNRNYSVTANPHRLKYEIYSFVKIISSEFELTPFVEDCIRFRLHEIWDQQQYLFKKVPYEDILLGLTMYCHECDGGHESLNIGHFAKALWGNRSQEHLILIFKAHQTFSSIFNPDQCVSS
jgi:hypothetical protein